MDAGHGAAEPVAIVGVGCRFPGGVASPEALWELLVAERDVVSSFPEDRGWASAGEAAGRGGFLDDAAGFDAALFGVGSREALAMDPQQRVLLEVAWEALERAGLDPRSLWGGDVGVFAGLSAGDYWSLLQRSAVDVEAYALTGAAGGAASGRIAFALGLEGPAVSVDTATSSSLVALHLACQALRAGECDLALAGGVTVLSTPAWFRGFAQQGALAPDGRCKPFAAAADGTAWSEGAAVVVAERLADALQLGHRVWAVVRGSAVNQDGASGALTAPSAVAQERLIRRALAAAGLGPGDVDAVEAHGTGTVAGDPVEAAAILATYGHDRTSPLALGAVKSNLGHTQAAGGLAGVVKMVLALRHELLPATLHVDAPSPLVDWSSGAVELLTAPRPWERVAGRPRRAGVSSLGLSGTNAHLILEEAPAAADAPPVDGRPPPQEALPVVPLVVSAASPEALPAQAARLTAYMEDNPGVGLASVGRSLATTRAALDERAVVLAADREAALALLGALAAGDRTAGLVSGQVVAGGVGFVLSGQGAQRAGMGRQLHDRFPAFAGPFDQACALFDRELHDDLARAGHDSLRSLVFAAAPDGSVDRTVFAQAGLFAVEVALVRLLAGLGIEPDVLAGHSIGELAAAHVAGVLSLDAACRLVAARGRLMQALPAGGAMWALDASEAAARELIAGHDDRVALAAVNGPDAVVLSGTAATVEELAARWQAAGPGRRAKRLRTSHAFHSPLVDPMLDAFAEVASTLDYRPPRRPLVSTVTGELVTDEVCSARYWVEQARRTVRFGDAVRTMASARTGLAALLEIGPDTQLAFLAQDVGAVGLLRADGDEAASLIAGLARAWVRGVAVDWGALLPDARTVDLPTYAFRHQRFWPTEGATAEPSAARRAVTPLATAGGERALVGLVRTEAAAVLGLAGAADIDPERSFKDLGFESRDAVELREGLQQATGLRLPSGVVFDHPSPAALGVALAARLAGVEEVGAPPTVLPVAAGGEPVAIVGAGCRFPGGVTSPETLWDLVAGRIDAIEPFPRDRGWEALLDGDVRGSFVRRGGFVATATGFDAGLFGISPREALAMDPQQRVLLEVAWEALERAGIGPRTLRGSDTGVFAGLMGSEYGQVLQQDPEAGGVGGVDGLGLTGGLGSVASGRLAYVLGLEGPAVTVDTACSSSLVALHLACQAVRAGECSMALAGGVTVLSTPSWFRGFAQQGGLAADGRCKAFGAGADGTGWSEGVGVVVVERLSEALRRGHTVWAVVRGSAVNQDGASNGLTAPNGSAQQRVIRRALAAAGLRPGDVDAVEAHGTGTALGDPIEAEALLATYGQDRGGAEARPLALGSVKSNLGHTQAAAGVAGVIKMVMALRRGWLPATLHADEPSPHVDWSSGEVELLTEGREWRPRADGRPRRAGVSSFGISGTNAHLILEEAPAPAEPTGRPASPVLPVSLVPPVPLVVSAGSAEALSDQARLLAAHLREHDDLDLRDVAWSSAASRAALEQRVAVVADSVGGVLDGLDALAAGRAAPASVVSGRAASSADAVFVYPGQGSQWVGMAAGLLEAFPVFGDAMAECEGAFSRLVDWSLTEVVSGRGEAWLDRVDVVQPALFAVMVSLTRLWESFGVRPAAVVGHSQGEIAAAHVAGGLSLEDAARVVVRRAQLLTRLSGGGGMVSLGASEARALELISPWSSLVGVATVNGPSSVTVSGEPGALDSLVARGEAEGVRCVRVAVDYASHSAQVEAIRDELLSVLGGIAPRSAAVPFFSTVTGALADTAELGAEYWYRNLRQPVRFVDAVRDLAGQGHRLFVEASPHPGLVAAVQETLDLAGAGVGSGRALGTLRRQDGGPQRMVTALAEAWAHGAAVDWRPLFPGARLVDLPTYPFQHQRYWPTVASTRTGPEAALLATEWVPVAAAPPAGGSRWAVVGGSPAVAAGLRAAGQAVDEHDDLAGVLAAGPVPEVVVWPVRGAGFEANGAADPAEQARQRVVEALAVVQRWLGDDRPRAAGARLVVLTEGRVPVEGARSPDDRSGLLQAPVAGLVRAVHQEEPGRVVLIDHDGDPRSLAALPAALAVAATSTEPELTLHTGRLLAPRLTRIPPPAPAGGGGFDGAGTVLVTGGTGTLGGLVARQLVDIHGVRSLLLVSRRGLAAPGAGKLVAGLEGAGATVAVAACDVGDRAALAAAIAGLPADRPLRGVVHLAGLLDDGVVGALTPERCATVWAPKAAGAWHLHELTQELGLDLSAFVVFSSTAGTLGAAGQANYAAASAFLDALVEHRHGAGLPASSLAWGLWDEASGLTAEVDEVARARLRRTGVLPLTTPDALALFDQALALPPDRSGRGVAALAIDLDGLRAAARRGAEPAVWRGLVGTGDRNRNRLPGTGGSSSSDVDEPTGLALRLVGLGPPERRRVLADLVRAEAAAVLGHPGPEAVAVGRPFKDLGFDSLTAVELRNRLSALADTALPTTLVFDHPTVDALVRELDRRLAPAARSPEDEARRRLADLEATLAALPTNGAGDGGDLTAELRAGLHRALAQLDRAGAGDIEAELADAGAAELLDLIDREFGEFGDLGGLDQEPSP